MGKISQVRIDAEIMELIPHRTPMLLINNLVSVKHNSSESLVVVDEQAPFYEADQGVPAWIGLEYMGQTAALIAGFQKQQAIASSDLGFLVGSRKYETCMSYFKPGTTLHVKCQEVALVGKSLATFSCTISEQGQENIIASAMLSVFRKPMS